MPVGYQRSIVRVRLRVKCPLIAGRGRAPRRTKCALQLHSEVPICLSVPQQGECSSLASEEVRSVSISPERFPASERASISEQAYQHLRSQILEQELEPGSIVTERRLAERLGASRTPLRAAINRLEGEGLVERLSNGSIVIRRVSIDELLEILAIRRLLEGEAAALAASRLAAEEIAPLLAESRELAANPTTEFEVFWRYDDRFHEQIARGSGKLLLATLISDLRNKGRMCNLRRMHKNFHAQAVEHIAVLEAIAAGDAKRSQRAMINHLDKVQSRLIRWLTNSQTENRR